MGEKRENKKTQYELAKLRAKQILVSS